MNEKLKGLDWHDLYDAGAMVNPKFFINREMVLEIVKTFNEVRDESPDLPAHIMADAVVIRLVPPFPEKLPWKEYMKSEFGIQVD